MRSFPFSELLDGLPTIKVVDVGPLADRADEAAYAALARKSLARVIGFQPNEIECDRLIEAARGRHDYLPILLGDGEMHPFHHCADPAWSSMLPPNAPLLALFQTLEDATRVVETEERSTVRLDDVAEAEGADLMRIDARGGTRALFEGAARTLKNAIVIHTVVEFVSLYEDQPLFAEIDEYLRACGFQFHRFQGLGGRTFKPLMAGENENAALSQFLFAEAVYVRDFAAFDALPADKLLKLAVILHESYRSFDLAALALEHHDRKAETGLWDGYIKRLTAARPPKTG